MKFINPLLLAGAIAYGFWTAQEASAATCGTVPLASNNDTFFDISNVAPSCIGASNGNFNAGAFFSPTFVHLDTTTNALGAADGALATTGTATTAPRNWSVNSLLVGGYTNLRLVFEHSGDSSDNPQWAVFAMDGNIFGGTWLVQTLVQIGQRPASITNLGLEYASLYGERLVTPVPPAFLLFGTVLAGFGGWRRWIRPREAA